ncbi:MAG TPA: hypothetical protein VK211_21090 [Kamptonema sp.]|nr:hypothetical protein [Kamptonema sp.]
MLLKMYALTGTALILWIAPLYALDKKVSWHRAIQGTSLIAAFGCALSASYTAKKLAENEAYENAKKAVLIGDLQDELAQGAYLSEQERKLQNQKYLQSLAAPGAPDDGASAPSRTDESHQLAPLLDKGLSQSHQPAHPIPEGWEFPDPKGAPDGAVRGVIVACIRAGWGQTKTIEAVFGISKSSKNTKYDAAKYWYQVIKDEVGE